MKRLPLLSIFSLIGGLFALCIVLGIVNYFVLSRWLNILTLNDIIECIGIAFVVSASVFLMKIARSEWVVAPRKLTKHLRDIEYNTPIELYEKFRAQFDIVLFNKERQEIKIVDSEFNRNVWIYCQSNEIILTSSCRWQHIVDLGAKNECVIAKMEEFIRE